MLNTELYIFYQENFPTPIENSCFQDSLLGWTCSDSTSATTRYNALFINPLYTGNTLSVSQTILNGIGIYKIRFKVVPALNFSTLIGNITISLGGYTTTITPVIGNNEVIIPVDAGYTGDKDILFTLGSTFNGGLSNISIEKIDGVWKKIDILNDINFSLNASIADIKDITKRSSGYSSTLTLPGSKNNNQIFKNLFNISETGTFLMNYPFQCYAIQGGLKIFEGSFEMTSVKMLLVNNIEYEASIYSNINSFYNNVSGKYLRGNDDTSLDLSFNEYRHKLDITGVTNSFLTSMGSGYTYILMDKGHYQTTKVESGAIVYDDAKPHYDIDEKGINFTIDELSPSLFIKEIWDKIFYDAGYTYTSTFLNTEYFKRLIYPHTDRDIYLTDREVDMKRGAVSFPTTLSSNTNISYPISWSQVDINPLTNNFLSNISYIIGEPSNYYIEMDLNITPYLNFSISNANKHYYMGQWDGSNVGITEIPYFQVNIYLVPNGTSNYIKLSSNKISLSYSQIQNSKLYLIVVNANGLYYGNGGQQLISFKSNKYNLKKGDRIYSEVLFYRNPKQLFKEITSSTIYYNPYQVCQFNSGSFRLVPDNSAAEGSQFDPTSILHEKINQIDFIKSIINLFNLYIEDRGNNNLIIEPREDFYNLPHNTYDWTTKLSIDSEYNIQPGSDLNRKYVDLLYTEDEDNFNKLYKAQNATNKVYGEYWQRGLYNRDVNDKYEVKPIFAPTIVGPVFVSQQRSKTSTIEIPKIYSWTSDAKKVDTNKKYKPRILYWGGLTVPFRSGETYNIYYDVTINSTLTGVISASTTLYQFPFASTVDGYYTDITNDLNYWLCENYWMYPNYLQDYSGITTANLVSKYWKDELNELMNPDTKILTAYFDLKHTDIYKIKFNDIILIQSQPYKINKIEDYTWQELTKVELLKSTKSYIDHFHKYATWQSQTHWYWQYDVGSNEIIQQINIIAPILPIDIITIGTGYGYGPMSPLEYYNFQQRLVFNTQNIANAQTIQMLQNQVIKQNIIGG